MLRIDTWFRKSLIVIAAMLALQAGAALAQDVPAAPAPVPGDAAAAAAVPALPDAAGDRRARLEALRQQWGDLALASPRGSGIQMIVQGEYIYILYGTVLCQLSAETLELKAKVDLRELVLGDQAAARQRRGNRGGRRANAAAVGPAVAAPPAEGEAAPGAPAQP